MACTVTLTSDYREITVAEFFGDRPFEIVDASDWRPGLVINSAILEPVCVLYLPECNVEEMKKCMVTGQSLDWVLRLTVDNVLSIESEADFNARIMKNKTLKNVGDDILYIGRFDPRNADNRFSSDMSSSDGANIEAVRPKTKRPRIKNIAESTKPSL